MIQDLSESWCVNGTDESTAWHGFDSSVPLKRCVTTLITAAEEAIFYPQSAFYPQSVFTLSLCFTAICFYPQSVLIIIISLCFTFSLCFTRSHPEPAVHFTSGPVRLVSRGKMVRGYSAKGRVIACRRGVNLTCDQASLPKTNEGTPDRRLA